MPKIYNWYNHRNGVKGRSVWISGRYVVRPPEYRLKYGTCARAYVRACAAILGIEVGRVITRYTSFGNTTSGVYHRLPPSAFGLWERWEPNRVNFDSVCGNLPNKILIRGGQRQETNAVANTGVSLPPVSCNRSESIKLQ